MDLDLPFMSKETFGSVILSSGANWRPRMPASAIRVLMLTLICMQVLLLPEGAAVVAVSIFLVKFFEPVRFARLNVLYS